MQQGLIQPLPRRRQLCLQHQHRHHYRHQHLQLQIQMLAMIQKPALHVHLTKVQLQHPKRECQKRAPALRLRLQP